MLGYFISNKDAKKLGLTHKSKISKLLQKVFFVVTDKDIIEKQRILDVDDLLSAGKISEISNRLNKNYYDSMIEVIINHLQYGKDKK